LYSNPKEDATAEIPPEVVKIEKIGAPITATAQPAGAKRKAKAPVKTRRKTAKPRRRKPEARAS